MTCGPGSTRETAKHEGSGWRSLQLPPQGRLLAASVGVTAGADAGNPAGIRAFAVFITDDGRLWINGSDGPTSTWSELDPISATAVASLPFGVTTVQHPNGLPRVRAFVTSTDTGWLWANESDGQSGTWTPMSPSNGMPAAISIPAGTRISLSSASRSATGVAAADRHLWSLGGDPDAGAQDWEDAGTPGTPGPNITKALVFAAPVAANGAASHGYTLVSTDDGHLWIHRDRHD